MIKFFIAHSPQTTDSQTCNVYCIVSVQQYYGTIIFYADSGREFPTKVVFTLPRVHQLAYSLNWKKSNRCGIKFYSACDRRAKNILK